MNAIRWAAGLGLAASLTGAAQAQSYTTRIHPLPHFIHDVAPAPGGLIWWTAQRDGMLAILDPRTGENTFVRLGERSSPHGVIQSRDGKAWITDSGQNAIVGYDPGTQQVRVYRLPADTGYANLNTPTEDGDGNIWFTGQNGFHGRLDVKTGEVSVWKSPRGRGPYGIATTPDGEVWFVSLANSYLGQVDRRSGEVKVIEPPVANAGLRRVWSDSKGDLWVSEWNTGGLARYSPKRATWSRWTIPGVEGAKLYAVYVDEKDRVWVSNWTDNRTYAFDPATAKFTAVAGSAQRANVRQILGSEGKVYLPESGNSAIMVVDTDARP